MKKKILYFLLLIPFYTFSQTEYCKGFKNGFKNGYCHQDSSCNAPLIGCDTPSTLNISSSIIYGSYQHGYNDGFAKGKNNKSNNQSQTSITSNINQANLTAGQQALDRQNNRSSSNSNSNWIAQLQLNNQHYEEMVSVNPELDLNRGGLKKFTIKGDRKYKLKLFKSKKWNEEEMENCYISFSRNFIDGSNIYFYGIPPSPIEIEGMTEEEFRDINYDSWNRSNLYINLGFRFKFIEGKGMVITELNEIPNGYKNNGGKIGDVITQINRESINNENSALKVLKNIEPGSTVEIIIIRDNETIKKDIFLPEGFFKKGKITISNLKGYFIAFSQSYEYYGDIFTKVIIDNFVFNENDVFDFQYQITYPQNLKPNLQFEKFKNAIKTHLSTIEIK